MLRKHKKMKSEFIEFKTEDGLNLPGLFYESKGSKAVAIFLHGNGSASVFYNEKKNHPLALALKKQGISILYFNNRGAHIIKRLKVMKKNKETPKYFGTAHEKIKECIYDIDGAVSFLKTRGYKKFYLIGVSTGANKICVYNFYKPKNKIEKCVLLSGGDDTASYYTHLGKTKFWKLLSKSKTKTKDKKGDEIIPELLPSFIFSHKGFYDIANPDGDYNTFPFYESLGKNKLSKKPLFRYFKSIKKPSFVIYGDKDQYLLNGIEDIIETLKAKQPNFDYKIIKGADHGFNGYEKELSRAVALWLKK